MEKIASAVQFHLRSGGTSPPASGEATAGHRNPGEDGRAGGRAGGAPGRMICDLYRGRTMRNASKVRSHPGSGFLTPMAPAVLAVAVVASALNSARLGALAPQAPPAPSFEVASIKPNNSGDGRVMLGNQPGR